MQNKPSLIFFGTSDYAVMVLRKLVESGFTPALVVTTPDKPAGKHLELKPSPVKVFALEHTLPLIQPEKLKNSEVIGELQSHHADLGIVVAYGKIIPQEIIDLPKHGLLNVHASLLPKLRGASPIETAILEDMKHTGVTIMNVDAELDHGPIVAAEEVVVEPWPPAAPELGQQLVDAGAKLLVKVIPEYLAGKIPSKEQDHTKATFTKKIEKSDGLLDLSADAYENFRKFQAYTPWPGTYFFVERNGKKIRVIIKRAEYNNNTFNILRVVPEGKKEMDYKEFVRSLGAE